MAWAKVDDKLHSTVKWRRASKGARALWTTALSWCSDQENDGRVPADMLRTLDGTNAEAKSLVAAGLWDEVRGGGWVFHDWQDYNPDGASKKAKREAESAGGKHGNHVRWHERKRIRVPECEFCYPDSGTRSGGDQVPNGVPESGANPPVPVPVKKDSRRSTSEGYVPREDEPPQLETSVPRHVLPPGWMPGNEHKAYAGERGINLDHELRQFWLHCRSKRTTSLDWDAEFMRWLGNARIPSGGGTKPTTSNKVRDGIALAERLAAEETANVVPIRPQIEGA